MTSPCEGHTDVWYSDDRDDQAAAKAGCRRCPLVVRCLVMALRQHERFGVWGSFTAAERADLLRAARRRATLAS